MIVFGCCVGPSGKWHQFAGPSVEREREPDSVVLTAIDQRSIFPAYNRFIDAALQAEALVLLHDDVELGAGFVDALRSVVTESPDIAVLGVVGARGVTSLRWWEGDTFGRAIDERDSFGGRPGVHDVEAVDGLLLVLMPPALRSVRFDDGSYRGFHGYDVDICFAARAAGLRVATAPLPHYHHSRGGYGDFRSFQRADLAFKAKWRLASRRDVAVGRTKLAIRSAQQKLLGPSSVA